MRDNFSSDAPHLRPGEPFGRAEFAAWVLVGCLLAVFGLVAGALVFDVARGWWLS